MVCLGNICRSPLAEGILTQLVEENNLDWIIDSAGTSSWHIGESPHNGSIQIAMKNGIDISHQKARQFSIDDFEKFDLILAMDSENLSNIMSMTSDESHKNKVKLILNYSNPGMNMTVPDPYYTGGFDNVFTLLKNASEQLLNNYKV